VILGHALCGGTMSVIDSMTNVGSQARVKLVVQKRAGSSVRILSRHSALFFSCSTLFNFLVAERANLN
jgi:hypothetical protein